MAGGLIGPWGAALKTLADFPSNVAKAKRRALAQEAQFFRTKIVEGLREQAPGGRAFKPLSEHTIALRQFFGFKGTKALVRRADLRNSIAVHELHDSEDSIFVGVMRTAKNAAGAALVDVARLNEEGSKPIIIKITPKMAALLGAAFRKLGGAANRMGPPKPKTGIIVVQIPARPFMAPVFEKFGQAEEASKRFAERFRKEMKGLGPWDAVKRRI
jgi:phage gpG-like protein